MHLWLDAEPNVPQLEKCNLWLYFPWSYETYLHLFSTRSSNWEDLVTCMVISLHKFYLPTPLPVDLRIGMGLPFNYQFSWFIHYSRHWALFLYFSFYHCSDVDFYFELVKLFGLELGYAIYCYQWRHSGMLVNLFQT
jgi:hypothetical protein